MTKKKSVIISILALTIIIPWMSNVNASVSKSDIQNQYNSILKTWNKNPEYIKKNSEYMGGYQCAAFSRFAFMNLWGHTDEIYDENNCVLINESLTTVKQVRAFIRKAASGDAIRIVRMSKGKQTEDTHIMQLFDFTQKGIIAYESNFEHNRNNIARFIIYPSVESWITSCTGIKKLSKKNWTVCVKIIHAKENRLTNKSLSINKVMLNKNRIKLRIGKTAKLKVINTKNQVKWTVSDKKIAKVTKKGIVKGKQTGKTVIFARVGNRVLKCKVVIKKKKTKQNNY